MAFQQGKALVFNPSALHHWAVWVFPDKDEVQVYCSDCDAHAFFTIAGVPHIRELASVGGELQVVTWVEVPGHGI
jgi:hypothetical protein